MTAIINSRVGQNRGKSRVWIEGRKLEREGFSVGKRYDVKVSEASIVLMLAEDGKYIVSKRTRNGQTSPIIDLNGSIISDSFEVESLIRIVVSNDKIVITIHHSTKLQNEREKRLLSKLKAGEILSVCSLFHGFGSLDVGLAEGLKESGIKSVIAVAVEMERQYLQASLSNNPELWDSNSCIIESPIESVNLSKSPTQVDALFAGIPCQGSSPSGVSKLHLSCAEEHPKTGNMFFYVLAAIQALNPTIVIIENVEAYSASVGMIVIRSVLGNLGYTLSETILDGNEHGALERRKRLCVVAISNGVFDGFEIDKVKPLRTKESCIKDILEDIPLDSDRWKAYDYLATKEIRDKAAGKGFVRQLLTGRESYCGVIGRGYFKGRSSEPFVVHPVHGERLTRLFSVSEHCRLKTVPERMVQGLSATLAHQCLGQGVIFQAFKAVGVHLANHLNRWQAHY